MAKLTSVKPLLSNMTSTLQPGPHAPRRTSEPHPFSTRHGRKVRDRIVVRDLCQCQMCGCLVLQGRDDPRAAVVDHIIPWRIRPDLKFEPSNLRTVCRDCHAICRSIEDRCGFDEELIVKEKLAITYRPQG